MYVCFSLCESAPPGLVYQKKSHHSATMVMQACGEDVHLHKNLAMMQDSSEDGLVHHNFQFVVIMLPSSMTDMFRVTGATCV